MLGINFLTTLGLLAFALGVTLLADWLVARFQKRSLWPESGFLPLASDWLWRLVWVALMYAGAAITVRYLERVGNDPPGYALLVVFVVFVLFLSLARAMLYQRIAWRWKHVQVQKAGLSPGWRGLLHNVIYILAALTLLLLLVWLAGQRLHWLALVVLVLAALLPDLDNQGSLLGRSLSFLSRPLQKKLGQQQAWHTPAVAIALAVLGLPLLTLGGWQAWIALPLGFAAHLLVDLLTPQGVMLRWPVNQTYHQVLGGLLSEPGGRIERWLSMLLGLATFLLVLVVGVGAEPPPPIVTLSYEQTIERYYAERGLTLVYARVHGTWQASGRRIAGTFEVLNAAGSSFVLLDRYTGQVFSAGRAAGDNLYVNSISLQTGEPARVKPAEIRLAGEPLANAFPVVYQLQAEPGLQHIYVSGDLVLVPGSPAPAIDYGQTSLRRIRELELGHYSMQYLTAAELIALGGLQIEKGDLLIVGTYAVPASGPTVTPLPRLATGGEAEQ